jgi:hypothetical protein
MGFAFGEQGAGAANYRVKPVRVSEPSGAKSGTNRSPTSRRAIRFRLRVLARNNGSGYRVSVA